MTTTRVLPAISFAAALFTSACSQQPTEPPAEPAAESSATRARPATSAPEGEIADRAEPPVAPRARGWRWRATTREIPDRAGWHFDAAAVETVEGEVSELVLTPGRGPRGGGVHLVLETASGPLTVAVGPAWYVERQEPAVGVGDSVRVVGARVDSGLFIAMKIHKGDDELVLRDGDGVPRWRGWRRGRGPRG